MVGVDSGVVWGRRSGVLRRHLGVMGSEDV